MREREDIGLDFQPPRLIDGKPTELRTHLSCKNKDLFAFSCHREAKSTVQPWYCTAVYTPIARVALPQQQLPLAYATQEGNQWPKRRAGAGLVASCVLGGRFDAWAGFVRLLVIACARCEDTLAHRLACGLARAAMDAGTLVWLYGLGIY